MSFNKSALGPKTIKPIKSLRILCILLTFVFLAIGSAYSASSLDKMAVTFQGEHTKEAIKEKLNKVFKLFEVNISEKNYGSAGILLSKYRKKYEVSEMEILDQMLFLYNKKKVIPFKKMAEKAAKSLSIK